MDQENKQTPQESDDQALMQASGAKAGRDWVCKKCGHTVCEDFIKFTRQGPLNMRRCRRCRDETPIH